MRTVDPVTWSKRVKKPNINVVRRLTFGQNEVSNFEIRLRNSFQDAMREYFRNCSVEGVGLFLDKSCRKSIRLIYLILFLVTMIFGLFVIAWNIQWFWNRPRLMINLQTTQNPVQKFDFPAVGICSYNIISRSALQDYAKYLYSLDKNNIYTVEEIKQNLLTFSALLSRTFTLFDDRFLKFLEEVANEINITNIMYKLSPKCESILVRCSWRSRQVNCPQIFATRLSNVGFCCIFNSRYNAVDRNNPPHKVGLVGEDTGLTVVVRENSDDFTFVRRLGDGIQVILFDGYQFPLVSAGIVRAYSVNRNATAMLKIHATAQEAASTMLDYSDQWLGCHMVRDRRSLVRSWSWCVGRCRARAALALCRCAPHTLPAPAPRAPPCSLEHLPCLSKHREKFTFLYPGDDVHESLSEEQEDSVSCLHCRADCRKLDYSAELFNSPHIPGMFLNKFFKGLDLTNTTMVSIFYARDNQRLYLVEPGLRWYEIFAPISSQCVFVVGLTLVSVVEFVYHITFRWLHHYTCRRRRDRRLRNLRRPPASDDVI